MKNLYFLMTILIILLTSCLYGVNKETSEICSINWFCNWDSLKIKYSTNQLTDSNYIRKLTEFKQLPFSTEVIYLNEHPRELIGISNDYYAVRYVYNPLISSQVLDGLSPLLPEGEKQRIKMRMDLIFKKLNCKEN